MISPYRDRKLRAASSAFSRRGTAALARTAAASMLSSQVRYRAGRRGRQAGARGPRPPGSQLSDRDRLAPERLAVGVLEDLDVLHDHAVPAQHEVATEVVERRVAV